jgi:hypothetical protein
VIRGKGNWGREIEGRVDERRREEGEGRRKGKGRRARAHALTQFLTHPPPPLTPTGGETRGARATVRARAGRTWAGKGGDARRREGRRERGEEEAEGTRANRG